MRGPLLSLLALTLLAASGARADGLVNGSLEPPAPFTGSQAVVPGAPKIPGWEVTGAGVHWTCGTFTFGAADGIAFVDVAGGGLRQVFATRPGETYDLRFAILASPDAELRVSVAGASAQVSGTDGPAPPGWEPRSLRFVAPGRSVTLAFDASGVRAGALLLDRIGVSAGASTAAGAPTWGGLKLRYR